MRTGRKALIAIGVAGLLIGLAFGAWMSSRSGASQEGQPAQPTVVPVACDADPPVTIPAKFRQEKPYPMSIATKGSYSAQIATSCGTLYIELDAKGAPVAVNNFVNLAKDRWYNWLTFDLVGAQPGTIQAGDPSVQGAGDPGYLIDNDRTAGEPYEVGDVAMVSAAPGKAASAFFVVVDDEGATLPPGSTIFGKLTGDTSLQVAQRIASIPVRNGAPTQIAWVQAVRIEAAP